MMTKPTNAFPMTEFYPVGTQAARYRPLSARCPTVQFSATTAATVRKAWSLCWCCCRPGSCSSDGGRRAAAAFCSKSEFTLAGSLWTEGSRWPCCRHLRSKILDCSTVSGCLLCQGRLHTREVPYRFVGLIWDLYSQTWDACALLVLKQRRSLTGLAPWDGSQNSDVRFHISCWKKWTRDSRN